MNVFPPSEKGFASIYLADGWLTVWEGAIRSGKTVASTIAWLLYVDSSPEHVFFMSGKTYGSLIRNVIQGDFGLLALAGSKARMSKDMTGSVVILLGDKKIYLFGATDESAYMRIKGLTAGGWYADEVATHPESFIVEALSRTAVSTDRRIFWTLNPTVPSHYIYKEFLDPWEIADPHGENGYRRFLFTLDDNLAMTAERRRELESQYHGRFRAMYILGQRVAAEGIIYDAFDRKRAVYSKPLLELSNAQKFIACDYGTVNPCVFLECAFYDGKVWVMREFRWDSRQSMEQKTDDQYVKDMMSFAGNPGECECTIIVDPSAASFITALKIAGYGVKPGKNDVLPGIRTIASLFSQDRVRIHESCKGLIAELEMYVWDEKAALNGEERPIKTNDHGPDALRYYVMTALSKFDLHLEGLK